MSYFAQHFDTTVHHCVEIFDTDRHVAAAHKQRRFAPSTVGGRSQNRCLLRHAAGRRPDRLASPVAPRRIAQRAVAKISTMRVTMHYRVATWVTAKWYDPGSKQHQQSYLMIEQLSFDLAQFLDEGYLFL